MHTFTTKACRWIGLVGLAVLLAACHVPSSSASADDWAPAPSGTASWFYPANRFKNPQALALARAAQDNDAAEVRRLIKDEHVNPDTLFSDNREGFPLVAWPVITESLGGLKALLDNGANPNARKPGHIVRKFKDGSVLDHFKYESAMVYATKTENPAFLKLLLEHGGDPNTHNGNDETLLFQAYIWHNQWQNVQVLVEHGADVNSVTQSKSILGDYTQEGDFKKAYWLLQRGADPRAQDSWITVVPGQPIRYFAVEDIFWYPEKPDFTPAKRQCQQWLLAHGFTRPPMPEHYRKQRKALGLPYEEKDIPLL